MTLAALSLHGLGQTCQVGDIDPNTGDTIVSCGPSLTNLDYLPVTTGQPSLVSSVSAAENTALANQALSQLPSTGSPATAALLIGGAILLAVLLK